MAAPLGNKNAAKKNRVIGDTLRRVVAQNPDKLRAACEALLDKAASGDYGSFKELRDTLDGKPAQAIVGDDENPLRVISRVERVIVGHQNSDG